MRSIRRSPSCLLLLPLLVAAATAACQDADEPTPGPDPSDPEPSAAASIDTAPQVYERSFAFLSSATDSATVVPWSFRTDRGPEGDRRTRHAWFARGGVWDTLALETESMPSDAAPPWRILPGRRIRVAVGEGDAVEVLVLRDSLRYVETRLEMPLAGWTGPGGEVIRLHRGTLALPGEEQEGYVLDLSLSGPPDRTGRDWMFLHGGDRLQAVFVEGHGTGSAGRGPFRSWIRYAVRELQWPFVNVDWPEVRGFEPARRDVPVEWEITSPSGDLTGRIRVVGSRLAAGEGEGPVLPVAGYFQVEGTVEIEGETLEVVGLVRHRVR